MEIKITVNDNITLLEVLKDGKPVNAQNPVLLGELSPALKELNAQIKGNEICMISGMPMHAICGIVAEIKNAFKVIAIYSKVENGCIICYSRKDGYEVDSILPLP